GGAHLRAGRVRQDLHLVGRATRHRGAAAARGGERHNDHPSHVKAPLRLPGEASDTFGLLVKRLWEAKFLSLDASQEYFTTPAADPAGAEKEQEIPCGPAGSAPKLPATSVHLREQR